MTNEVKILDGKRVSLELQQQLSEKIAERVAAGFAAPGLAVVLVGDDPASQVYVKNKMKACERTGIRSIEYFLPAETSEQELCQLIDNLNFDPKINGILVQLPLPKHINETTITNHIDPNKDVDGFHARNVGHLALRQPGLRPCTPRGVMTLLRYYNINPKGKRCVVVGASNIVGRPLLLELLYIGATVTCCHRFTKDLAHHIADAEILFVGIGKIGVVKTEWIPDNCVVIDIGINRKASGGICGDIDFQTAQHKVSAITPVPGGIGPMTVATLMQNTFEASLEP